MYCTETARAHLPIPSATIAVTLPHACLGSFPKATHRCFAPSCLILQHLATDRSIDKMWQMEDLYKMPYPGDKAFAGFRFMWHNMAFVSWWRSH